MVGSDSGAVTIHLRSLFAEGIQFSTSSAPDEHTIGFVYWDEDANTLAVMTDVQNVVLQVGQEQYIKVRNKTGSQINNGEAVYVTGAVGEQPTIAKARADAEATSYAIGLMTEDIADNGQSYCTTSGVVRDIDTDAFNEGNLLWLSSTAAGGLTTTKPAAPNHAVRVGCVLKAHATEGMILVTM